jgi:NADH:ubiquinone oxidoreductase subunit C
MGSKEENLRDALQKAFPGKLEVHIQRHRRVWVTLAREDLVRVVKHLAKPMGFEHLALISGADVGEKGILLVYHFFHSGVMLNLKVLVPKSDPKVDTITGIFPGATLYEREFYEMVGVTPVGHKNLVRLLLPDNWPGGNPMMKDWKQPAVWPEGGEKNG